MLRQLIALVSAIYGALLVVAGPPSIVATAAGRIPATAIFRDAYAIDSLGFAGWSDRVRSDSMAPGVAAPYNDGGDCVASWVQASQFFLRTVTANCSPYSRALVLDFSEPVVVAASCVVTDAAGHGTLDICGPNLVPDARLIASGLFARAAAANGTPASFYFSLAPDFQATGYQLTYREDLPVTETTMGRVLTASTELVDLYKLSGRKKVLLGTYRMPFEVSVQPR